uniref:Uncharacterized protein n=1 Tax=Mycena chlorophos TaxID=658473 RepID=A0ABQ0L925_MYCCL|nr:predicted protein [Mycena chlorophos]
MKTKSQSTTSKGRKSHGPAHRPSPSSSYQPGSSSSYTLQSSSPRSLTTSSGSSSAVSTPSPLGTKQLRDNIEILLASIGLLLDPGEPINKNSAYRAILKDLAPDLKANLCPTTLSGEAAECETLPHELGRIFQNMGKGPRVAGLGAWMVKCLTCNRNKYIGDPRPLSKGGSPRVQLVVRVLQAIRDLRIRDPDAGSASIANAINQASILNSRGAQSAASTSAAAATMGDDDIISISDGTSDDISDYDFVDESETFVPAPREVIGEGGERWLVAGNMRGDDLPPPLPANQVVVVAPEEAPAAAQDVVAPKDMPAPAAPAAPPMRAQSHISIASTPERPSTTIVYLAFYDSRKNPLVIELPVELDQSSSHSMTTLVLSDFRHHLSGTRFPLDADLQLDAEIERYLPGPSGDWVPFRFDQRIIVQSRDDVIYLRKKSVQVTLPQHFYQLTNPTPILLSLTSTSPTNRDEFLRLLRAQLSLLAMPALARCSTSTVPKLRTRASLGEEQPRHHLNALLGARNTHSPPPGAAVGDTKRLPKVNKLACWRKSAPPAVKSRAERECAACTLPPLCSPLAAESFRVAPEPCTGLPPTTTHPIRAAQSRLNPAQATSQPVSTPTPPIPIRCRQPFDSGRRLTPLTPATRPPISTPMPSPHSQLLSANDELQPCISPAAHVNTGPVPPSSQTKPIRTGRERLRENGYEGQLGRVRAHQEREHYPGECLADE